VEKKPMLAIGCVASYISLMVGVSNPRMHDKSLHEEVEFL